MIGYGGSLVCETDFLLLFTLEFEQSSWEEEEEAPFDFTIVTKENRILQTLTP